MRFRLTDRRYPAPSPGEAALQPDNWDDYGFKTTFNLYIGRLSDEPVLVGTVKIAKRGQQAGAALIDQIFEELPSDYFSLGQSDAFYSNLNRLGPTLRDEVLAALRDVVWDLERFNEVRDEPAMRESLLRFVSEHSVSGQYRRIALGGPRLSRFSLQYSPPQTTHDLPTNSESSTYSEPSTDRNAPTFTFLADPESVPPSNVHVLIGRNGVGKSRTLRLLRRALQSGEQTSDAGELRMVGDETDGEGFARVIYVSFSAFDPLEAAEAPNRDEGGLSSAYIGLQETSTAEPRPLTPPEITEQFVESLHACFTRGHRDRWIRAIHFLESDPFFADVELGSLASAPSRAASRETFSPLSSGHRLVLLTMTRLVELVEERTIVLIDEPESHLHPPLLSSFVRALSDLMSEQNGVAIAATHSPVVLQEVPRTCVWKIHRAGFEVKLNRPSLETFGENVGVLTREVFGLEVTESGFHRLIADAVGSGSSYQQVLASFGGQIGNEAAALAQVLLANRDRPE